MAAKKQSSGKSTGKRGRVENLIPFKPGQSGNPAGRRKGQRNFKTLFDIALQHIADSSKKPGVTADVVEEAMHVKAIEQVLRRGDFFFYKELNERLHGKVTDKMDLTSKGKTLADVILAAANAKKASKRGAK